MKNYLTLGPVTVRIWPDRYVAWGMPLLKIGGLSLFVRDSGGKMMLASYHPRGCPTWHWVVSLGYWSGKPWRFIVRPPMEFRRGQWSTYVCLPFCVSILIQRQDYHRDKEFLARYAANTGRR